METSNNGIFYTTRGTFGQCKREAYVRGLEVRRATQAKFPAWDLYTVNDEYAGCVLCVTEGESSDLLEATGEYAIFICSDMVQA